MKEWLAYYLVFVAAALLLIAVIISRLKVKSPARLIILLSILIISPVAISYIISTYFNPLPETMVPNLIGKSLTEAQDIAETLNLEIKIESQVGESDEISYQRPEEGRIVKVGRTIYVTLGTKVPQTASEEVEIEEGETATDEQF